MSLSSQLIQSQEAEDEDVTLSTLQSLSQYCHSGTTCCHYVITVYKIAEVSCCCVTQLFACGALALCSKLYALQHPWKRNGMWSKQCVVIAMWHLEQASFTHPSPQQNLVAQVAVFSAESSLNRCQTNFWQGLGGRSQARVTMASLKLERDLRKSFFQKATSPGHKLHHLFPEPREIGYGLRQAK